MLPPFVHSRAMCPARPHRSHLMAGHALARCLCRAGVSRRRACIRLHIPEGRPGRERHTPCRRSYCTSAAANTGQPSARSGRTACTPPSRLSIHELKTALTATSPDSPPWPTNPSTNPRDPPEKFNEQQRRTSLGAVLKAADRSAQTPRPTCILRLGASCFCVVCTRRAMQSW